MLRERKTLNLALRGGGALGALTWGVLDRLLEEPRLRIEAISGTSAGAMNAAALASGWVKGDRAGARETLSSSWEAVGSCNYPLTSAAETSTQLMIDLSRLFSPYQLNPFDINPLRRIISELIDFEALRSPRANGRFPVQCRIPA
jgi:NTE family protein